MSIVLQGVTLRDTFPFQLRQDEGTTGVYQARAPGRTRRKNTVNWSSRRWFSESSFRLRFKGSLKNNSSSNSKNFIQDSIKTVHLLSHSGFYFETGLDSVAKDDHKLEAILLPKHSKRWYYRCEQLYPWGGT